MDSKQPRYESHGTLMCNDENELQEIQLHSEAAGDGESEPDMASRRKCK